jgi:hypothetical protein
MKKMPIAISIISDVDSKSFDSKEVVDFRASSFSEDIKASLYVQSNT